MSDFFKLLRICSLFRNAGIKLYTVVAMEEFNEEQGGIMH